MTIINTQITGSSSPVPPTPTEKYALFSQVPGTNCWVLGHFTDSNNNKYAVCYEVVNNNLVYESGYLMDANHTTAYYPNYTDTKSAFNAKETATTNCNGIKEDLDEYGYGSVLPNVRQHSITVDGTTYYGQVPNIKELFFLFSNADWLYNKFNITITNLTPALASTQINTNFCVFFNSISTFANRNSKATLSGYNFVIYEIPIID